MWDTGSSETSFVDDGISFAPLFGQNPLLQSQSADRSRPRFQIRSGRRDCAVNNRIARHTRAWMTRIVRLKRLTIRKVVQKMKSPITSPILISAVALMLVAVAFVGYQAISAQTTQEELDRRSTVGAHRDSPPPTTVSACCWSGTIPTTTRLPATSVWRRYHRDSHEGAERAPVPTTSCSCTSMHTGSSGEPLPRQRLRGARDGVRIRGRPRSARTASEGACVGGGRR